MERCVESCGWIVRWCAIAVALLAGTIAARAADGFVLEMEIANPRSGAAQLFYDVGQWYSVRDSARVEIPAGEALRLYRFAIPAKPVKRLRFDPADGEAIVRIGRMRLLTADGAELARFGPERLVPMHAIAGVRIDAGVAQVTTTADDPMLLIARSLHEESVRSLGRPLISRGAVLALAAVVAFALGVGLWGALRALRGTGSVMVFLGGFLVVGGARLWWLRDYSRGLPFWDDWKTGAIDLLIPAQGGFLDWETLFAPHGEHRILVTRLITLAGSLLNGEWDPRVAMTVGALCFAAGIALLAGMVVRAGQRRGLMFAAALVACGCLPFDFRNLYWGDQSQMYALQLLAIVTLTIAATANVTRFTGVAAVAAAAVSLFTMGSGFVAPGIAAVMCGWRARRDAAQRGRLWTLAAIFVLFAIAGVALYRTAPFQSADYARTWAQFFHAFVARAAWPLPPHLWCVALVWLPWVLVTLGVMRGRRVEPLDWLALGLGAWALVNAAGLAHGRSQEAAPFDAKYYTAMSVGVFANLLAAGALIARWRDVPRRASLATLAALVAAVALATFGVTGIQGSRDQFNARTANDELVRAHLATRDSTVLRETPWHQLPYWNGAELADLLETPSLQTWLPAPLRNALAQRSGVSAGGKQSAGPVTLTARTLMKLGAAFVALGAVILIWCALSGRALGSRAERVGT